jgi:TonB family protein
MIVALMLAADQTPRVVAPMPVISPPVITPIYPAPPVRTLAAKARGNVAALFSMDDYPISAIQNGEEGVVQAQLLIGPDGRLAGCVIFRSSGSTALDQATCAILQRRARFVPARDGHGNPTSDQMMVRIRWELPEAAPFSDWTERAIVSFDAKGRHSGCRYEIDGRGEQLSDCSRYLERAQNLVNGHPDLGKRSLSIVFEKQFEANPKAWSRAVGSASGEQLIELQVTEFDIDPAGNSANCRVTLRKGGISEGNLCEEPHYDLYDPLPAGAKATTRHGRSISAAYLRR